MSIKTNHGLKNSKDRIWTLLVLGNRVHCFPAVWTIKCSNRSCFRVPRPGERTSDRELQYRYLKYMNSIHVNFWHEGSNSTRIHVNSVFSDILLAIPDDILVITKVTNRGVRIIHILFSYTNLSSTHHPSYSRTNPQWDCLNVCHNVICALYNIDTLYRCKTGLHKAMQGSKCI